MFNAYLGLLGVLGAAATAWAAPTFVAVPLRSGVEYATLEPAKDDVFHIVRIDPKRVSLSAALASATPDRQPRTAKQWCDDRRLVAAINLGMYLDDHRSNVGYAAVGAHVNQKRWHPEYKSVLVWGPKKKGLVNATILDLDAPADKARIADYQNAVQNLRLIKAPGQNVWTDQPRRWSESAIALDGAGRILFVFARRGHKMIDFNQVLIDHLDVKRAMHVEGGPEASLCVRGKAPLDLFGSYETGFWPRDDNAAQWAIPNVIGVPAEPTPKN